MAEQKSQVIELAYSVRVEVLYDEGTSDAAIVGAAREVGTEVLAKGIRPSVLWDNARLGRTDITTVVTCPICVEHAGGMMPPHTASPRCESGGRNHCTCDTCF